MIFVWRSALVVFVLIRLCSVYFACVNEVRSLRFVLELDSRLKMKRDADKICEVIITGQKAGVVRMVPDKSAFVLYILQNVLHELQIEEYN